MTLVTLICFLFCGGVPIDRGRFLYRGCRTWNLFHLGVCADDLLLAQAHFVDWGQRTGSGLVLMVQPIHHCRIWILRKLTIRFHLDWFRLSDFPPLRTDVYVTMHASAVERVMCRRLVKATILVHNMRNRANRRSPAISRLTRSVSCRGSSVVASLSGDWTDSPRREIEQIRLPNGSGESKVGLLEASSVQLQSGKARRFLDLGDRMYDRLDAVLFAPDCGRHRADLRTQRHHADMIPPRHLDRGDVKPENVAGCMSASHVKRCMTLVARHTGSMVGLAQLADLIVSRSRYRSSGYAFGNLQSSGVAEAYLRGPDRASHVNPVVVHSALQRFAWLFRPPLFSLLLRVGSEEVGGKLSLQFLLFAVSVRLLPVEGFGRF